MTDGEAVGVVALMLVMIGGGTGLVMWLTPLDFPQAAFVAMVAFMVWWVVSFALSSPDTPEAERD